MESTEDSSKSGIKTVPLQPWKVELGWKDFVLKFAQLIQIKRKVGYQIFPWNEWKGSTLTKWKYWGSQRYGRAFEVTSYK